MPDFRLEDWLWCPICGTRLMSIRCKMICTSCNYFMSCSEFDG